MSVYLYSILSVMAVSMISLIGIFTLSLKEQLIKKYLFLLVSLAVGALIGDAFIHLIPEAFEATNNPTFISLLIIGGILIFFILEKILHWHHHHLDDDKCSLIHPTGKMILFSDGVHNFIDGLIIGISYMVSVEIGIATTIAIILHEIPQEIGDFGVLIHSGYSTKRALFLNFISSITALSGTIIALIIGNSIEIITLWLIPIAAGGFIYIAMTDLIPEIHKTKHWPHSILQFAFILIGIVAMILLLALE